LNKNWGGTVFTERIIEWVTKFWSTFTLVFVATFVDSFRDWFIEDWTRWNFWGSTVFTTDLNDFP
jgi:hypothetical protein